MTEQANVVSPILTITVDGNPREIFMSFALLNRVCYLMGDSTQVPLILQDPELREAVLIEALAERDSKGKVLKRYQMDEISVSFEDIQNLLEFVSEHVVDFTVAAVERANKVMAARMDRIGAIPKPSSSTATLTGPESSASKTPAA